MCPGSVVIGSSGDVEIWGGGVFTTDGSLREATPPPPFLHLEVFSIMDHLKSKRALKLLVASNSLIHMFSSLRARRDRHEIAAAHVNSGDGRRTLA